MTTTVEGFLIKRKAKSTLATLTSNFVKRWFVLDLDRFVFGYTNARGKELSTSVPLRDIHDVRNATRSEPLLKDWPFEFHVVTAERTFELFSRSTYDIDRWLTAFRILFQFKHRDQLVPPAKSSRHE